MSEIASPENSSSTRHRTAGDGEIAKAETPPEINIRRARAAKVTSPSIDRHDRKASDENLLVYTPSSEPNLLSRTASSELNLLSRTPSPDKNAQKSKSHTKRCSEDDFRI